MHRFAALFARRGRLGPPGELEAAAIRRVGGGRVHNPGLRVALNVLPSPEAEAALVAELRGLRDTHGFVSSQPVDALATAGGGGATRTLGTVSPVRVTGRPEGQPRPAAWGYAGEFRRAAVTPLLLKLADSFATLPGWGLADRPLRDVTVNYRDPHTDPPDDGPSVVVVGLLSDVVLTFVPPSPVGPHGGAGPPPPRRRTDAASIAARSWTDGDLDVLLKRRGAVLFTGDARTAWHHAIRAGVVVGGDDAFDGCGDPTPPLQQAAAAPAVVCDWWGSMGVLLRRAPERVSVVLAFG